MRLQNLFLNGFLLLDKEKTTKTEPVATHCSRSSNQGMNKPLKMQEDESDQSDHIGVER